MSYNGLMGRLRGADKLCPAPLGQQTWLQRYSTALSNLAHLHTTVTNASSRHVVSTQNLKDSVYKIDLVQHHKVKAKASYHQMRAGTQAQGEP